MVNRHVSTMRAALLASSVLCGALAATPVFAAEGDETAEVEELVVTGSRIARPNLTETTPVQVVGSQDMTNQGFENVTDILTQLPQFAASFGASRTQSTFSGAIASGLNTTNLRNLGPQRSLTLINGRRFPSGVIFNEAVDFNMIPSANIERIEVITGGASAIYGADAVAGVINVITDNDFEGLEIGASYSAAIENWDNINPSAYLKFGGKIGDRGQITATLQYDYQGLVSCADRYLCAEDFAWLDPKAPWTRGPAARSGVPANGRFFVDGGAALGYTFRNGQLATFDTALDGYNRNADRTLAIPTERILFASQASYELNDLAELFVELNYGSTETNAPFEGHPFQSNNDRVSGLLEPSIPASNPFIPASLRALMGGDQELTWYQRFNGLESRGANNTRQTTRVALGVRGDFDKLFGMVGDNWNYEASYVYGVTSIDSLTNGLVSRQALYDGLRVEADPQRPGQYRCTSAVARAQGCVPINPFDGYDAGEQAALLRAAGARGESEHETGQAFLSGSLFELPAGPLQVALGFESRRTTAYLDFDSDINLGITTGNQIFDNKAQTKLTNEVFGEVVVPLLRDLPLVDFLAVEGAYRSSDSSLYGAYDTYGYGMNWTAIPGVRFRANKSRAIREPSLGESTGGGQTAGVVADPCVDDGRRTANATRAANCLADGVPLGYRPALSIEQGVQGVQLGNPNLRPEVADTVTFGVVVQAAQFDWAPSWLQEFTLTVDRFTIAVEDLINPPGRQVVANLCYDTAGPGRADYCSALTRGAHPLLGGGNYALLTVNEQVVNGASLEVKGVDIQATYAWDTAEKPLFGFEGIGRFSINTAWTFYDEALSQPYASAPKRDVLGFAGGSTSEAGFLKKQGNTAITWTLDGWSATYTNRFIGETKNSPFAATPITIDAHAYHSVHLQYAFENDLMVYGGVNNLMDTQPPFFPTGTAGTQALDTVPAYYDVIGRQAYVGFKARF